MFRLLFPVVFLSAALPVAAHAADLNRQEIADELVGRTIVWWEAAGWRHGYLVLFPNGAAEMTVDRPRQQHDVGHWSLRDGQICTRWGEARSGLEKCYAISRGEGGTFVTSGGNVFQVRELGV